jgi:S1-C subfamily serine protease
MIRAIAAVFLLFLSGVSAVAQQAVWVQIEAQPTLTAAQDRVRAYATRLQNVAGFYLGGGWYGIVLGPYAPVDADALLRDLRNQGVIPSDSFIATGGQFQQQYWPIGVAAETQPQPLPGAQDVIGGVVTETLTIAPLPEPAPLAIPDESVSEARASEGLLDRPQREELQIALLWAGFYSGAIDGAYGSGTRNSMAAWQGANNHEVTGVMTTAQRAELLRSYNAVLDGMNLQVVRDTATGIAIEVPTGVVKFAKYEPPFARFDASGTVPAQVLLISQSGDQDRLFGLYEILQTLAIVPLDGPRERTEQGFVIEGTNDKITSYTSVGLQDGQIKGFTLVWPAGDDARRTRVLDRMKASFTRLDGVLDPGLAIPDENQAIDLVAGLEVRKPKLSRSGFFIGRDGTVLTTNEVVESCERLTIDDAHDADVVFQDAATGLAVLRPQEPLSPLGVAAFQTGVPRLQSEIAVAGYPYGPVLVAPSLTFGTLADLRGLNGEETIKRLSLTAQAGDAGGPVFDNGGAVLGMLLPKVPLNGQVLPPDVGFSVDTDVILATLTAAGITADTTDTLAYMPPETLTLRATDQTVLVSCW